MICKKCSKEHFGDHHICSLGDLFRNDLKKNLSVMVKK